MSKINVIVQKVNSHLPTGVVFDHTEVVVVDSAGVSSSQVVSGPAWSAQFDVADGAGSATAIDMDAEGNAIGTPAVVSFDTLAGLFPSSVGLTVTVA